MKRSKVTCPRLITAISSFGTSLSKRGDNVVKLLKVKGNDDRSAVMMKGDFFIFFLQKIIFKKQTLFLDVTVISRGLNITWIFFLFYQKTIFF